MRAELKAIHCIAFVKVDGGLSIRTTDDVAVAKSTWDNWSTAKDNADADSDSDTTELLHTSGIWYTAGRVFKQRSLQ